MLSALAVLVSFLVLCHSIPPDKMKPLHIIKTRSIDQDNTSGLNTESKLDKSLEPTGYRLKLEPNLEKAVYIGHVSINVIWLQDTSSVSVHCAHDVEITESEVMVYLPTDAKIPQKISIKEASRDSRKPIFTLRLEKTVPKSSVGSINFRFKGHMQTDSTEAFFKFTYPGDQGVERTVAALQLRGNNARRVFPCFDEPEYKTPFEISVVRPRSMVALSNMRVARNEDINGEPNAVWDHFEKTLPISTFALGLVIADLEQLGESFKYKDHNGNDIEMRIWGRSEYHPKLECLNEKVVQVLAEAASFWEVPLPLRHLDLVTLPSEQNLKLFDSWGLLVFMESDLSEHVYIQLAQATTYQWLGPLAMPVFWPELHLKALAGFIAGEIAFKLNNGSDTVEEKWPIRMMYTHYYHLSRGYLRGKDDEDMKKSTAYTKIMLLYRMFNYTIGEDTLKKGLRTLLEAKKYKTFTGDDIWNALNEAALIDGKIPKDVDILTVATSWIEKDRLPLVTVKRNYDSNSAVVTQKLYLRDRPHDKSDSSKMSWGVPIVMMRNDNLDFTNTSPIAWMKDREALTLDNMPDKDHFIIVNPEEIAPFPVNYDTHNWNLLSEYLQGDDRLKIPEITRAKLLHDTWNLAYAGELSFATALNMTLFLKHEKHYLVWDPWFIMLDHIGRPMCPSISKKFRAYVINFLSPLYDELKKGVRDDLEECLYKSAKHALCDVGYQPCVQTAQDHYRKWMQATNPDEGNPIRNQYTNCPVFKWGTQKEWDFGLQRVINFPPSQPQSERRYLLKTLAGCPRDENKITKILNITLLEKNGNFTDSDLNLIFSMLTGSARGYTTLFHFLTNNWEFLKENYSNKTKVWNNLISSATTEFKTQEGFDLVSDFYLAHQGEFGSAEHIVQQGLKDILEETKWSSENIPVMEQWLDNYLETSRNKM